MTYRCGANEEAHSAADPVSPFRRRFRYGGAPFTQGDFVSCSQLIATLQEPRNAEKLTAEQKKKLLAMQEYLLGNDPGEIQKIVKEAQKTASHQGWRNDDLLKHASQLIRRAEYWKQRGIPEYQELSDAAAKLLEQAGDNGSSDIAIRLVILQTKISISTASFRNL